MVLMVLPPSWFALVIYMVLLPYCRVLPLTGGAVPACTARQAVKAWCSRACRPPRLQTRKLPREKPAKICRCSSLPAWPTTAGLQSRACFYSAIGIIVQRTGHVNKFSSRFLSFPFKLFRSLSHIPLSLYFSSLIFKILFHSSVARLCLY